MIETIVDYIKQKIIITDEKKYTEFVRLESDKNISIFVDTNVVCAFKPLPKLPGVSNVRLCYSDPQFFEQLDEFILP